jgi:hypothetical protein
MPHRFLIAAAAFTGFATIAVAVALQATAVIPLFGFDTRPIATPAHELGYAYIAPVEHSWSSAFSDQRAYVTENGRRLGPANSQHADIRNIGRGAFSFWHDGLRFSASDNSDPTSNGRAYVMHVPKSPSLLIAILALFGITASSLSLYRCIGRDRVEAFRSKMGLDGMLMVFAGFAASTFALQPWAFLTRTTNDQADWARITVTAVLALGFSFVRATDLEKSARALLRFFAVMAAVICGLRWYPDHPSYSRELNDWLLHGGRWLGTAAAIISWWRPSFLLFALCAGMWARRTDEYLTGFAQADTDEAPVVEMAIFLLLWVFVAALASRIKWGGAASSSRALTLGVYGALGIHLANYFYSSVAKMRLEGPVGSWIVHNPTHALLANAKQLGVAPLDALPNIFNAIYGLMGHGIVGVNVLTWAGQAASVPAILATPSLPWLLIVLDMWHFGVFATTGIFFWKWMVVNAGFVAALRCSEKPVPMMIRASSLILCFAAPLAFHLFPAGWYDTFNLNRLEVFAVTDKERVRVPPAFFGHYAYSAAGYTFWAPGLFRALYPTGTYGTTYSLEESIRSASCPPVKGLAPGEAPFRPGLAALVHSLHRGALARVDAAGHPSAFAYAMYPYHIATNPSSFRGFWSLDLREVKSYAFEIQAVCTAGSSLNNQARTGAGAEVVVDVR